MQRQWMMVLLAISSAASVCPGITWDNSYEGDNYDAANDRFATGIAGDYFELERAKGDRATPVLATENGTDYVILQIGEGGELRYRHTKNCCPQLLNMWLGWTVETRLRIAAYTLSPYNSGLFRLSGDDEGAVAALVIGNAVGPNVVGSAPATVDDGDWSWEPDVPDRQTLVEPLSDWHVYRLVYQPNGPPGEEVEIYVDGRLLAKGTTTETSDEGRSITFGSLAPETAVEVDIDYIRWAGTQVEAPTTDTFESPILKNGTFDNLYDPNGFSYPPIPAGGIPRWDVVTTSGTAPTLSEEMFSWACEPYGKTLRMTGGGHHTALKQQVSVSNGTRWTFTAAMNGLFSSGVPRFRAGIDPDGVGGDPTYPGIVWGAWVELVDGEGNPYPNCVPAAVSAWANSDDIWVFIDVDAEGSADLFIDNAQLVPAAPCNVPGQDADGDNDVDVSDFAQFQLCFSGATVPYSTEGNLGHVCPCMDADGDTDVDVADFSAFQLCFSGAAIVSPCFAP